MKELQFSTISVGNSSYIRGVSAPLAETLEEAVSAASILTGGEKWLEDENMLRLDPRRKLEGGVTLAVTAILFFVGKWAAKKALDELYAGEIRPALRRFLLSRKAPDVPAVAAPRTRLVLGIWIAPQRCLVLVKIRARDYVELAELVSDAWEELHAKAEQAVLDRASGEVHAFSFPSERTEVAVYKSLQEALEAGET